ncbi:MAG TPA: hydroxymethylglutaryl-CoA lyase [Polyangiaceae bacterium]|nr:hydroxymethylglutaryl-CoA lyase [Polyangiaceae bacterium]
MAEELTICDVGPRDGLQSQPTLVSTEDKRALIRDLLGAGLRQLEVTSFVSPKAVPQMADAEAVMGELAWRPDVRAYVLLMNERGYARANAAGARALTIVAVCSETFAQRNNGRSARETIETARRILSLARADGMFVRVALAAAWHCPYEGPVDPGHVRALADEVWAMGVDELSLADTIGYAHPGEVRALLRPLVDAYGPRVTAHFHDTQALGLANAAAAIEAGVRGFDSSIGGLGGCPFAPGAAGNLASEDLALMAYKMGFQTGVDLDALWRCVEALERVLERPLGGRTRAWWRSREKS